MSLTEKDQPFFRKLLLLAAVLWALTLLPQIGAILMNAAVREPDIQFLKTYGLVSTLVALAIQLLLQGIMAALLWRMMKGRPSVAGRIALGAGFILILLILISGVYSITALYRFPVVTEALTKLQAILGRATDIVLGCWMIALLWDWIGRLSSRVLRGVAGTVAAYRLIDWALELEEVLWKRTHPLLNNPLDPAASVLNAWSPWVAAGLMVVLLTAGALGRGFYPVRQEGD